MDGSDDIELAQSAHHGANITSLSSSFEIDRYKARTHVFRSTRDTTSRRHPESHVEYRESNILHILRLLSHHKIRVFPTDLLSTQEVREQLGQGSTFHVYASELPIWRALARFQYRNPTFPRRGERFHFIDHTETRWNRATKGAYKTLLYDENTRRDQLLADLIVELRILCHPPLQRHPNIIHVLGFVWIRDEQFFANANELVEQSEEFGEPREWPTIVAEKAPHGSLRDFLGSGEYGNVPSSLRAKVLLCADVLNGLVALHACDILHGDVKCDNALVYDNSTEGTAENWRIKLSDFSHSIILNEDEFKPEDVKRLIRGTRLYNPPELQLERPYQTLQQVKYSDIWSFGLLVWEVMLDGTLPRCTIEEFREQRLCTIGLRHLTPVEHCEEYLQMRHPREHRLIQVILGFLDTCLQHDPLCRSSARHLLAYLQEKMGLGERYNLPQSPRNSAQLASLDDVPFFEVSDHYYDLLSTLTVSQQVFKGLDDLVRSWPLANPRPNPKLRMRLGAELQLGLCYAAGFGVQSDRQKAIAHITNAARAGLEPARAILPRVYAGLGTRIEDACLPEIVSWLEDAWRSGSVTAMQDLHTLRAHINTVTPYTLPVTLRPREGHSKRLLDLPPLHAAVLSGNIEAVIQHSSSRQEVNVRGVCGEVALHYTIFVPASAGNLIAETLLNAGADVFKPTSDTITFSEQAFILNDVGVGMTPLHLAISHDHVALFKLFMEFQMDPSNERLWGPQGSVLALAARYQSIQCLTYLLADPTWSLLCEEHVNRFDDRKLSPMYYACRPDYFDHLCRYQLDGIHPHPVALPERPIVTKESQIISLLRSVHATLKVHQDDIFTVMHLLTSFGDHALLDQLLSENDGSDLKDQRSEAGWTPLFDAIARGRLDTFHLLLKHDVQMSNIWTDSSPQDMHALHFCSMHPGSVAVTFAESIFKKDPKCLSSKDSSGNSPLHVAATYGRVQLIRYLAGRNAFLYARNHSNRTPLGCAIADRVAIAVRELCRIFEQSSLPHISHFSGARKWSEGFHPVHQLMAEWSRADIQQSDEASLALLRELLQYFPSRTVFGVNAVQRMLYYPIDLSGVDFAISRGNTEAVRTILDSVDKTAHLSYWQLQRLIWGEARQWDTDEEAKTAVTEEIWSKCDSKFRCMRAQRLARPSLLPVFWRIYYSLYGNLEHRQFARSVEWLKKNHHLQQYRRQPLEYSEWLPTRLPLMSFNFLLLLVVELPALGYFIATARDPYARWKPITSMWVTVAFLLTNFMPFWGSAFRVSFVYFNSLRTEYSPVCAARSLLQVAFVISVNVLSIFAALLLFPPWEGRLLSSSFWSGLAGQGEDIRHADDDFMQLPRASQERIRNLNHWCGALVSWHLIAIALPALACCMFSVMDGCIRRRMQHHYLCTNRPPSDRNTTTH